MHTFPTQERRTRSLKYWPGRISGVLRGTPGWRRREPGRDRRHGGSLRLLTCTSYWGRTGTRVPAVMSLWQLERSAGLGEGLTAPSPVEGGISLPQLNRSQSETQRLGFRPQRLESTVDTGLPARRRKPAASCSGRGRSGSDDFQPSRRHSYAQVGSNPVSGP